MGSSFFLSTVAKRLEGKVALITGGAGGLGQCTAKLFSQHGAKVVIADIQDELGHSICDELGHVNASFIHCDVTNEADVKNAIDATVARHGKLDIMYNNAGIVDEPKSCILDNEKEDFERVLKINVIGTFLGTKHAARVMIPACCGSIISTSSISSVVGAAASHAYACSKHAVAGLMKNAAVELGQFGIRVNCVSPFVVATPLAEKFIKRRGEELEKCVSACANLKGVYLKAEDVAQAVLYLGSDDSRYVSGHNLFVDGGFSIVNPSFGMFNYSAS